MNTQLKAIKENLISCFNGKPWYGISLMEKLNTIDFTKVNQMQYGEKSIAVLVQHIQNWRVFVLKKLEGDAGYEIEMNSTNDWTPVHVENEQEWQALKEQLVDTQTKILAILNELDDSILSKQVPGKDYTFEPLLTSIAQHDIYHLGQIAMLNADQEASV